MPIYEFKCSDCRNVFEEWYSSSVINEPAECPQCSGHNVDKLFSAFGISGGGVGRSAASSGKSGCTSCTTKSCATCR